MEQKYIFGREEVQLKGSGWLSLLLARFAKREKGFYADITEEVILNVLVLILLP